MVILPIKEFFEKSSFHGFRFIVQKDLHWTERLVWFVLCIAAWASTVLLVVASWNAYQYHAISFIISTDYMNWNTTFPAITVCEHNNRKMVSRFAKSYLGEPHHPLLDELLKEIAFFPSGENYIKYHCGFNNRRAKLNCSVGSPRDLAREMRSPCDTVFRNCFWRNKPFHCCQHFLPLETEFGKCYTINSVHSRNANQSLDMISNWRNGLGYLTIEIMVPSVVYIHGPEEVPTSNLPIVDQLELLPREHKTLVYAVREMSNEIEVRQVSADRRRCHYPDENMLFLYDHYSYYGCLLECQRRLQIELCNCTNFLMPRVKQEEACDLKGAYCLLKEREKIVNLSPQPGRSKNTLCPCPLTCEELTLTLIREEKTTIPLTMNVTHMLTVKLAHLPSERDHRQVVRTALDLVVSIGSAGSLLVGASMLSFLELFYYFLMRPWLSLQRDPRLTADKEKPRLRVHRRLKSTASWHMINVHILTNRHEKATTHNTRF